MAIRKIELYPSEVLREKAKEVEEFDGDLQKLLDDMVETMKHAKGAGLAGNQVGVPLRVIVVDFGALEGKEDIKFFINPEVVSEEGERKDNEGCLSFPQIFVEVKRPKKIKVRALDRDGKPFEIEGEDFLSKALSHEIDHLNGVLMIDHLSPIKREFIKKKIKKMIKEGQWDNPYPQE
ncbi:MAG: peptide deformylase [Acidobacteria bacterium]|nr:peptide deformylase [Acidobacteriota bacterium]